MKTRSALPLLFTVVLLLTALSGTGRAQQPPPQQQPASVAGNWTIYSKGANGETATQYIDLQQNGPTITGHFKGPHQSGGLDGTINQQHIVFRTKTRAVLTFRGRVNGNRVEGVVQGTTMNGTFHTRAGTGEWQASRATSQSSPD